MMKALTPPKKEIQLSEIYKNVDRPVYIYLFGENKEWNSTDNLKIFGKVKVWKLLAALNFRRILRIKT